MTTTLADSPEFELEHSHDGASARVFDTYPNKMLRGPALIFAAEGGDAKLGCGQALQALSAAKQNVLVIVVAKAQHRLHDQAESIGLPNWISPSSSGLPNRPTDANLLYWHASALGIEYGDETVERISQLLESTRARVIYAPSTAERRPDRLALALAVRDAVRRASYPCFLAAYHLSPAADAANIVNIRRLVASEQTEAAQLDSEDAPFGEDTPGVNSAGGFEQYALYARRALIEPVPALATYPSWDQMSFANTVGPLVSLITRTTNRPELAAALDSVAAQTYRHIEVVLVDVLGQGLLSNWIRCGQFPLRVVCKQAHLNRGMAANAGLEEARGDYVIFLDDDDWLLPNHVQTLISAVTNQTNPKAAYVGVKCITLTESGKWRHLSEYNADYDRDQLLVDNFLPIHAVLFDRALVGDHLRFDESLEVYEDWDFWLQLSELTPLAHIDKFTAVYRISQESGFGRNIHHPATERGYEAVIEKWWSRWTVQERSRVARDAARERAPCGGHDRRSWISEATARQKSQVGALRRLAETSQALAEERDGMVHALSEQIKAHETKTAQLQADANAAKVAMQQSQSLRESLLRRLDRLQTGPAWQLSLPLRFVESRSPKLLSAVAGLPKLVWWMLSGRLLYRMRMKRSANRIIANGLFDRDWYIRENPDVVLHGMHPLVHWLVLGWKAGKWPNPLFDTGWYLQHYPDAVGSSMNPLQHYLTHGVVAGHDPNPLFQTRWYLDQNPDVAEAGMNPLGHYLTVGASEGCDPNPLFDSDWYLAQNPDVAVAGVNPLAHYLYTGTHEGRDPSPFFDTDWYLEKNPDVAAAGAHPLAHFLATGAFEGRDPGPRFSTSAYMQEHPRVAESGLNPLAHFLLSHQPPAATPVGGTSGQFAEFYTEMLAKASRKPKATAYMPDTRVELDASTVPVRLIAFYLPQFHPIPENDAWWGKGFTEWTNVSKAVPQFAGHHQPRLPDALGFYDLRVKEVQREQIALAKKYGIYGFCYHYYWFAGRRLLERPLQQMLDDPTLDFPFCICWANENWTRRWDGLDQEVLIGQEHSLETDRAFIADLEAAFRDPRYITIDGRPLLIVYRPQLFPDPAATAAHWREYARERGLPEPYIVNVRSIPEAVDPRVVGFDAAVEFPPHQYPCVDVTDQFSLLNKDFQGHIFDYQACVRTAQENARKPWPFELFPGVMTAWDNTPRRLGQGTVYANASPEQYRRWLTAACERALRQPDQDRRLVFINAWNEWAEGTYLEPDRKYGYAYLRTTSDVLASLPATPSHDLAPPSVRLAATPRRALLIIGHDAHKHGAQLLTLHLAELLSRRFGLRIVIWLLEGGDLEGAYRRVAEVQRVDQLPGGVQAGLRNLRAHGIHNAITNTVVTGEMVPLLKQAGFSVLSLVHEMPALIRERGLQNRAVALATHADQVVFAADTVRTGFSTIAQVPPGKSVILPQGIYQSLRTEPNARARVEGELGLPADAILVFNAGYGDARKGFDWFLDCARKVTEADPRFHFLWVGKLDLELEQRFERERRIGRLVAHLHQLPFTGNIARYFAAADIFLLTSREDPFPSVVLEALASGSPVVAFEGSGGHCKLLQDTPWLGALATPMGDVDALATTLRAVATDEAAHPAHRARRTQLAKARFDFGHYGWSLLGQIDPSLRSVSVVVPNYNYAQHIQARLESIFDQTYPVYEVIVLDDASTDGSPVAIRQVSEQRQRQVRLIKNTENSGSVFKQWAKGIREAQGELVWIAEADDLAEPDFLARLVSAISTGDDVLFAFSDSAQIDHTGASSGTSYAAYCNAYTDLDFSADFTLSAQQFLAQAISVKNNVLNVSAVLFRRGALAQALANVEAELADWTIAGDWRLYIELCKQPGSVAYISDSLNTHRRHAESVVGSNKLQTHIDEISRIHQIVAMVAPGHSAALKRQKQYVQSLKQRTRS